MKLFLLQLLLIFTFPTLIFGIQCAVGGKCYQADITKFLVDVPIKTCKDACVYFKCASNLGDDKSGIYVSEGYGCLEDFLNVCRYAPTNVKEDATRNINNNQYLISNDDLTFRSCSDKDECSTNGSTIWTSDNVEFNIGSVYREYNKTNFCSYDKKPKTWRRLSSVTKCERYVGCQSGKSYFFKASHYEWEDFDKYNGTIECDACLGFKCSNDGGNTVVNGHGCWDDFEHACSIVPNDVKEGIKRNINDSFYYGKNYRVISCGYTQEYNKYCRSYFYDDYKPYNSLADKIFKANVNKKYDKECEIDFHTPPPATTESNHAQENGFKLNELLFIGLIFIYFM